MKRIRLTTRIANRNLIAYAYDKLQKRLLVEYPDFRDEAKFYKDGETDGFELHHLLDSHDNLVPSTMDSCRDEKIRDKKGQSKYIMAVIEYSKMNSVKEKQEFICEQDLKGLKLNDRDLVNDKKKLDHEIENAVYIPKKFHNYLHGRNLYVDSREELRELYKKYMETSFLENLIKTSKQAEGSIEDEMKVLKDMTDYILYKGDKQAVIDIIDASYRKALNYLRELRRE